mmetsp:Transcript_8549/g.29227  ORF Transcript_8549/g.29227 Transcript_8549/m.29227 type:complete len:251 (+) Transcript_8549:981-1733(+)
MTTGTSAKLSPRAFESKSAWSMPSRSGKAAAARWSGTTKRSTWSTLNNRKAPAWSRRAANDSFRRGSSTKLNSGTPAAMPSSSPPVARVQASTWLRHSTRASVPAKVNSRDFRGACSRSKRRSSPSSAAGAAPQCAATASTSAATVSKVRPAAASALTAPAQAPPSRPAASKTAPKRALTSKGRDRPAPAGAPSSPASSLSCPSLAQSSSSESLSPAKRHWPSPSALASEFAPRAFTSSGLTPRCVPRYW